MEGLPLFDEISSGMAVLLVVGGVVAVILGTVFTFLPTIIGRNKKNSRAIFVLNFFAGWTFIGWIVALVWACTADSPEDQRQARPLAIGTILTLLVLINFGVLGAVIYAGYWTAGVAAEAAQQEIKAQEERQAQRDASAAQADAEAKRRVEEMQAQWRAEEAAREMDRKRSEFERLPQWDRYGRAINRDFEVFLEEGEQTAAQATAAEPVRSIYPPGVDTPEERREYLKAHRAGRRGN